MIGARIGSAPPAKLRRVVLVDVAVAPDAEAGALCGGLLIAERSEERRGSLGAALCDAEESLLDVRLVQVQLLVVE